MSNIAVKRVPDASVSLPVFEELAQRMDEVQRRAFELFAERGFLPGRELDDWFAAEQEVLGWPAAELTEKNGAYEMDLTLPGYEAKDVEVTAQPDAIMVRASVEKKAQGEDKRVLWSEFGRSDVCRQVKLPTAIDLDHVTAELSNGLLKVRAPKAKGVEPAPKQVPITAK